MEKLLLLAGVLVFLLVGVSIADDPIPATSETQGISSTTAIVVLGSMSEEESSVWTMSNEDLRDNPPLDRWYEDVFVDIWGHFTPGGLDVDGDWGIDVTYPERQAVMSYTETTLSDNGHTGYDALVNIDTANKMANQDNFGTGRQIDFVASPGTMGRLTTSESLLLDEASQGSAPPDSLFLSVILGDNVAGYMFMASSDNTCDRMLCPWALPADNFIPGYCNVIEMGSTFSGSNVAMATSAGERHVAGAADIPVAASYDIDLSGTGSAESHINAHTMEGRSAGWVQDFDSYLEIQQESIEFGFEYQKYIEQFQADDLVYKEKTTAAGTIASFSKSMSYQSAMEGTCS